MKQMLEITNNRKERQDQPNTKENHESNHSIFINLNRKVMRTIYCKCRGFESYKNNLRIKNNGC